MPALLTWNSYLCLLALKVGSRGCGSVGRASLSSRLRHLPGNIPSPSLRFRVHRDRSCKEEYQGVWVYCSANVNTREIWCGVNQGRSYLSEAYINVRAAVALALDKRTKTDIQSLRYKFNKTCNKWLLCSDNGFLQFKCIWLMA